MENTAVAKAIDLPGATALALDRTRLAHERTLMAWVRTAMSLITFGFTIYKFFQYLIEKGQGAPREGMIGPRGYGLLMIGTGLFALLLATISHRREMQAMRKTYGKVPYSLAAVLAAAISLLGIVSFFAVVLRQ